MGKSCSIDAYVRNSKGEVVKSKLFSDLLSHLNNRESAKGYYKVGTDSQFLEKVKDKAEFDENGEITFNSLRKLANIDIKEENLLGTLNKKIKSGLYEYNEAVTRMNSFNRNSGFKEDYMATIVQNDGKFHLSVIPRTASAEADLQTLVENRTLRDKLIYHLSRAGVEVEFFEKEDGVNGRYSTINAKKTAHGMYQLIKVAKGEKLTETLAEEAGHFAVGSLGNSPLVQRLINTLTPEVQKKILGNEYDEKSLGQNAAREVAGHLVGQAIIGKLDKKTVWGKLADRVVDLAKRIYASFKSDVVMQAELEAKEAARQIAEGFIASEQQGSVEEALKIKETLYSAENSTNTKTFRELVNKLKLATAQLKAISNDALSTKMEHILGVTEAGRTTTINKSPGTIMADAMALEGIAEAISSILDMVGPGKEINNILDSVDFLNIADFNANMVENGRKLRQVHLFVKNSISMQECITEALLPLAGKGTVRGDLRNVQIMDSLGNIQTVDITAILRQLTELNSSLLADVLNKEKQFFQRFLENTLGRKYVYRASRAIWNIGKNKKKNSEGKTPLIRIEEGKRVDLSSILECLEDDISFFDLHLSSMSNNSDIVGQIVDKATKMANKQADDITNRVWDELRILEKRFKKFGIQRSALLERDENGNYTGNIISSHNWGAYEKAWKEYKDEHKKNFEENSVGLDNLSEFEKAMRWDAYFRPLAKDWHKNNSTWSEEQGRYVPNDDYKNDDFSILMSRNPELKGWYNDYRQLKDNLDSLLPEGSTLSVRLPQFKGTFVDIAKNHGGIKGVGAALRSKLIDAFCESSEDTDFGADNTYNSEEEQVFANTLAMEKERINRIPLFGINKLKNMQELSTDIFGSTLSYAAMASSYAAMSTIVDTMEVGSNVLKETRKVEGVFREKDRKTTSSSYTRYLKFLDKQVYGISSSKFVLFKKIVWEKIVGTLTGLASKYFLGGNVVGGAVNTINGFTELFKEALADENIGVKDFLHANKLYFGNFVQNWSEYGSEFKENKVGLFIRHFNMRGDNREAYRNWNTARGRRLYNMFAESLMLPYKSGDHYMQSISYLALAHKTKLYKPDGTSITMYDAYEKTDNVDTYEREGGKTLELKDTYFKSKAGIDEYNLIISILDQLTANSSNPFGNVINLSTEQQEYLDKKGYRVADLANTIRKLQEDSYNLTWQVEDESTFMDKCREINNRMHGIYNNQDKTYFHQKWYGSMLLSMKGYALGMMERRWSRGHYNVALGHDVEGSMQTLGKSIIRMGIPKTMLFLMLPMSKRMKLEYYKAGFSRNQVANMKRNSGDALIITALFMLRMFSALEEDDEEKKKRRKELGLPDPQPDVWLGRLYYFSNRVYREQAAFNLPVHMFQEAKSLGDLVPPGVAALFDWGKLGYELIFGPWADEGNSSFYFQSEKPGRHEKGDLKGEVHFWRMFPYVRSIYTWEHPYEAAKSYEYGKNIKNR